jgi:hypothetical protein
MRSRFTLKRFALTSRPWLRSPIKTSTVRKHFWSDVRIGLELRSL